MQPLQRAAGDGLGVIAVRHERKSGGDIGDSGRGSSAFGGAVDTLITIHRGDGNTAATVRVVESISRYDDVPPKLYIELGPDGYTVLGEEGDIANQKARAYLLESAPTSEGDAESVDELAKGAGVGKTALRDATAGLVGESLLHRTGAGKRGDAYRYWRAVIDSSAYRVTVADGRNSDTKSTPSEPGAPSMLDRHVGELVPDPSAASAIHSSATTTLYTEESKSEVPTVAEQLELPAAGVTVTVDGQALELRPGSKVPEDLMAEARQHKVGLIERLGQDEPPKRYQRLSPGETANDAELAGIERQVSEHGVCLLWSEVLQDHIAFYATEPDRAKVPPGFVPFCATELRELFGADRPDMSPDTLRLIHTAKVLGATVTGHHEGQRCPEEAPMRCSACGEGVRQEPEPK
jgi:hypothetical protein